MKKKPTKRKKKTDKLPLKDMPDTIKLSDKLSEEELIAYRLSEGGELPVFVTSKKRSHAEHVRIVNSYCGIFAGMGYSVDDYLREKKAEREAENRD